MKRFLNVALNVVIAVSLLILLASLIWYIWDPANRELAAKITVTLLVVFVGGMFAKFTMIMREELR